MIKKAVTVLALCVAAATYAQENAVYSANIVGFVKTEVPTGLQIVGMQFHNDKTDVADVFGDTLPKNSEVMVFDGENYVIATYCDVFVPEQGGLVLKWNQALDLDVAGGFWVKVPENATVMTSGSVPTDPSITVNLKEGLQLVSYPYPVDVSLEDMEFTPSEGDEVMVFDGKSYKICTYCEVFTPDQGFVLKWNDTADIKAGQGFWYNAKADIDWVVTRPYNID